MPFVTILLFKVSKVNMGCHASDSTNGSHLEEKHLYSEVSRLIIINSLYKYNETNPLVPGTSL